MLVPVSGFTVPWKITLQMKNMYRRKKWRSGSVPRLWLCAKSDTEYDFSSS